MTPFTDKRQPSSRLVGISSACIVNLLISSRPSNTDTPRPKERYTHGGPVAVPTPGENNDELPNQPRGRWQVANLGPQVEHL